MQTKILLCSLLAALLSIGVISTPTGIKPRGSVSINIGLDGTGPLLEITTPSAGQVSIDVASSIIPKKGDLPVVSTSVKARDLESLEKRAPGCIFGTSDPYFTGRPARTCLPSKNACHVMTAFWRTNISSFRPGRDTICKIFTEPDCSGAESVPFEYPGYEDLGIFNDNMGSLACEW